MPDIALRLSPQDGCASMKSFLLRLAPLALLLALAGCGRDAPPVSVAGGDPARGKALVRDFGCAACHVVPGIAGHGSNVGPPLQKMGVRAYIGGVLPNTPEDMVRWLRDPPAVDPRTAMPNLGLSDAEARDIAAFLYTLR